MLAEIFKEIKKKSKFYSNCTNGDDFENKFRNILKSSGFSEIVQKSGTKSAITEISFLEKIDQKFIQSIFKKLKTKILSKDTSENIENPFLKIKNTFIFQPYGSQNFPDFIIFLEKYVIPIEIKYSKNPYGKSHSNYSRPMWNSNLPKPNSIYIYGLASKDVTYFRGSDILDPKTRKVLIDFFNDIEKKEDELDNKLLGLKNNFGMYPYLRKAYDHKLHKSTYLNNKKVKKIESYFSENAKKRERKVISFLHDIEKKW